MPNKIWNEFALELAPDLVRPLPIWSHPKSVWKWPKTYISHESTSGYRTRAHGWFGLSQHCIMITAAELTRGNCINWWRKNIFGLLDRPHSSVTLPLVWNLTEFGKPSGMFHWAQREVITPQQGSHKDIYAKMLRHFVKMFKQNQVVQGIVVKYWGKVYSGHH